MLINRLSNGLAPQSLAEGFVWSFVESVPSTLTFSRASSATYFDSTGVMQTAASGAPRFDYDPSTLLIRGLRMEEQRTNYIPNNSMVGAASGTPGTLPTGWAIYTAITGLTRELSVGTEKGMPYVDYRLYGTPSASGGYNLFLNGTGSISAAQGDVFSLSSYLKLSAGSTTNILCSLGVDEQNGSTYLGGGNGSTITLGGSLQRSVFTRTIASATTNNIKTKLYFYISGPVDFTIRIYQPQTEKGSFATSCIPTTGAAATRAADRLYTTNLSPWFNATIGTFVTESIVPYATRDARSYTAGFSDGTGNNVMAAMYETTGVPTGAEVISGSVVLSGQALTVVTSYAVNKMALKYESGSNVFATNGLIDTAGTLGAASVPTVNRLDLGNNALDTRALNGWLRSFKYWGKALSSAELTRITT